MTRTIRVTLREQLKNRGITQAELAQRTGLTTRTISELCSGKMKQYPRKALESIAEVLHINDISQIIEIIDK